MQIEIPTGEGLTKVSGTYQAPNGEYSQLNGMWVDNMLAVDRMWVEDVAREAVGAGSNGYIEAQTLTVDNMNGQYGNDIHVNGNMRHNHEVTFNGNVRMNMFNAGSPLSQITTEDSQAEAYTKINKMIVALNQLMGQYEDAIDHTKIAESELVEGESELEEVVVGSFEEIESVFPKNWPTKLNETRVEIDENMAKQFNENVAFDGIKELIGE